MKHYFYLLYPYKPNVVTLQLPVYIGAENHKQAIAKADDLKSLVSEQFELLLDPSEPLFYDENINGPSCGAFFTALGNGRATTLHLPEDFEIKVYQFEHDRAVKQLDALTLLSDDQENIYRL